MDQLSVDRDQLVNWLRLETTEWVLRVLEERFPRNWVATEDFPSLQRLRGHQEVLSALRGIVDLHDME